MGIFDQVFMPPASRRSTSTMFDMFESPLTRGLRNTTPFGQPRTSQGFNVRFGPEAPDFSNITMPETPPPSLFSQLQEFYGNRPNYKRFMEMAENAPKAEDYQPSKWRRLGAALVGGAQGFASRNPMEGFRAAESTNYAPYTAAMNEYQGNFKRAAELAGLESDQSNVLAGAILEDSRNTRDDERWGKEFDLKNRMFIHQQNQDGIIDYTDLTDGMLKRRYPNGRVEIIGKSSLTPEQINAEYDRRQELENKHRLGQIDRTTQGNIEVQGAMTDRQLAVLEQQINGRIAVNEAKLKAQIQNPDATEQFKQIAMALQQAGAQDRELFAYFQVDPMTGLYQMVEPWFGFDQNKYNTVQRILASQPQVRPFNPSGINFIGGGGGNQSTPNVTAPSGGGVGAWYMDPATGVWKQR